MPLVIDPKYSVSILTVHLFNFGFPILRLSLQLKYRRDLEGKSLSLILTHIILLVFQNLNGFSEVILDVAVFWSLRK